MMYKFTVYENDTPKKVGVYSSSLEEAWETIREYYLNNKIEYDGN